MATLKLSAGDRTEELVQFLTGLIDDQELDLIKIDRDIARPDRLASEPITTAVTITLGTAMVVAVLRLVERWLENQRQLKTLKIVADGFSRSDEEGKHLANLAAKHANVSVSYALAKESWTK